MFLDGIVVFVLSVLISTVLRSEQCAGIRISLFIFIFLTAIGSSGGGGGGAFDGKVCLILFVSEVDVLRFPDVVVELISLSLSQRQRMCGQAGGSSGRCQQLSAR